ncbi:MAG: bifunctional 4-hydroxy-2-oxoglutarate aldolase/2-dehydro-3-deoxy-phosphogluconate aldolase [Clostridiaceae bacterium]|jgi:2-dehydro-3-deoxyphosphogluconate aldolase/(4S)-4-hydroxy-2-oxoglutarate aldolase|nr:bifunctional 4-hydroxy-2-oxoglutarate aldolase/2-dehydro-3-deoxy-phosphogluconate aldolase [Clostridiaceae bacterium]
MEKHDNEQNLIEQLEKNRVVAIVRHLPEDQLEPVFTALAEAGIRLIEVTMNSAGAAEQISRAQRLLGERMLIGAGTVSTPDRAQAALAAGARFLVTPNLDLDVVAIARRQRCPVIPGVMTPTEMMTAVKAGVNVLKLFPASQLGPAYVKDVLAPLDELKLVAVGGVTPQNSADWLKAGCIGVGMGSSLLPKALIDNRQYGQLRQQTEAFIRQLIG